TRAFTAHRDDSAGSVAGDHDLIKQVATDNIVLHLNLSPLRSKPRRQVANRSPRTRRITLPQAFPKGIRRTLICTNFVSSWGSAYGRLRIFVGENITGGGLFSVRMSSVRMRSSIARR